ncbi:MAG: helix-turn-helix transcriptional regulator [Gemmatimonadaceae bacterium]
MSRNSVASSLVKSARAQAGMTQRELAKKARTSQSVVARVELGETSPSLKTLSRLVKAAGFDVAAQLQRIPTVDPSILDDIPRILRMTPEERLREVAQVGRFVLAARRV